MDIRKHVCTIPVALVVAIATSGCTAGFGGGETTPPVSMTSESVTPGLSPSVNDGEEPASADSPGVVPSTADTYPEKYETSIGGFSLGQTPEALVSILKKDGIQIIVPDPPDNNIKNTVKDGRVYNEDGSFSYMTKDYNFLYDVSGKEVEINTTSKKVSTIEGVKVGDKKVTGWGISTESIASMGD